MIMNSNPRDFVTLSSVLLHWNFVFNAEHRTYTKDACKFPAKEMSFSAHSKITSPAPPSCRHVMILIVLTLCKCCCVRLVLYTLSTQKTLHILKLAKDTKLSSNIRYGFLYDHALAFLHGQQSIYYRLPLQKKNRLVEAEEALDSMTL